MFALVMMTLPPVQIFTLFSLVAYSATEKLLKVSHRNNKVRETLVNFGSSR